MRSSAVDLVFSQEELTEMVTDFLAKRPQSDERDFMLGASLAGMTVEYAALLQADPTTGARPFFVRLSDGVLAGYDRAGKGKAYGS